MEQAIGTHGVRISRRSVLLAPATAVAVAQGEKNSRSSGAWNPQLSERIGNMEPGTLRWLRQMGAQHVVWDARDPEKKGYLSSEDIQGAKKLCRDADLTLEVVVIPNSHYQQAMLGRRGRDEEIEKVCRTIRGVSEVGVPTCMWVFTLDGFWDERVGYYPIKARGEAIERAFDYNRVKDSPPFEEFGVVPEKEMWDRLLYFAKPVVAAAEKANVRLALHPNDPPAPVMRSVARVIHSPEGYLRLFKEVPSPANGMTFCQGTFTEMGTDVLAEIRRFGRMGKINLVHFRAVRGKFPQYTEVFLDEGDVNMIQAMKTYKDVGYTGPIVSDHQPQMEGEKPSGYVGGRTGMSLAHGYMRAAVQAANML